MEFFGPAKGFKTDIYAAVGVYLFATILILLFFTIAPAGKWKVTEIIAADLIFGSILFVVGFVFYMSIPFAEFRIDDRKIIRRKFGIIKSVAWDEVEGIEKRDMPFPMNYWGSKRYIIKTRRGRLFFSEKLENADQLWEIVKARTKMKSPK